MPTQPDLGYRKGQAAPGERLPGFALVADIGATYTNDNATTPETSLMSTGAAIADAFPAAKNIGDSYDILVAGTFLNTSGSNKTNRIRIYHGAFAIFDQTTGLLSSNAATRNWWVRLTVMVSVVGTTSTGNLRVFGDAYGFGSAIPGTGAGWNSTATNMASSNGGEATGTSANLATNAARDFNVTCVHSAAGTSLSTVMNLCVVRQFPKNLK